MSEGKKKEWDRIYKEHSLEKISWHSEKPAEYLVELVKKKK